MSTRLRFGLAATVAAILLLVGASLVFAVMQHEWIRIYSVLAMSSFVVVGLVILRNRPTNTVGWCFMVASLLLSFNGFGDAGLDAGAPRHWPGGWLHVFAWATGATWMPGLFVLITVALLHFPDGPVSRRWLWLSWVSIGLMATFFVAFSTVMWQVPIAQIVNDDTPHLPGLPGVLVLIGLTTLPAMLPVVAGVVSSLVVRYRRSSGVGRLQIRWVAAAGTVAVAAELGVDLVGSLASLDAAVQTVVESTAFSLIAVATGIAITRHGLYEIDRIVSRSVSYLVISAVLVGVYAVVVAAAALVIPDRYGSAGVAAATLAAVALFVPLRSRVQRVVDRRFDRGRYDTERTVGGFAAALRENRTLDDVHEELLRAVRRTVAPSSATIWIASSISIAPERAP